MKPSYKEVIRKLLVQHPDGLTAEGIGERLGVRTSVVRRCIDLSMPDCYIDRWSDPVRGQYQAVYRRADIPNNCPHPTDRYAVTKVETVWRTRSSAALERMAA